MGYFDGMTSALIRQGSDGKSYYAPLGKYGRIHEVPDAQASKKVQGRWRAFYMAVFAVMIGLVLYTNADWRVLLAAPLVGLLAVPFGLWAARGLPVASITTADLRPVTRAEAMKSYSVATGRRTLGWVPVGSLLMTGLGVVGAFLSREPSAWLGAGFFFLCSVAICRAYQRAG